jgi:hypothetical protein
MEQNFINFLQGFDADFELAAGGLGGKKVVIKLVISFP